MFFDLALAYDPELRRCDLVTGADEDLAIDETAVTPMLTSVGLDRRAAPDDPLPEGAHSYLDAAGLSQRRGWPGDGLDPEGDATGCKLWLLDRAKQTETTRLLFLMWLDEAMSWADRDFGEPAEMEAAWVRPGVLAWRVKVGPASLALTQGFD